MDWRKLRDKLLAEEKAAKEGGAPEEIAQSTEQDGPPPAIAPLAEPEGSGKTAARQITPPEAEGEKAELDPPPAAQEGVSWDELKSDPSERESGKVRKKRPAEEEREAAEPRESADGELEAEEEPEAAEARESAEERPAAKARKAEEELEAAEARESADGELEAEEEREAAEARKAEEEREAAEARKAEEEREAAEVRKAEEEREAAEARKAEEEREAAEARKAEEEREAAEARKAEEEREAAEARKAEEEREAAEARKAEEEREAAEARKAEEEREAAEARQAEEEREAAEARKAEEEREAAEARQAEEEREAAEARKAEEEREAAEARQAEEEREAAEARESAEEREAAEARKAEEEREAAEVRQAEEEREAAEARKAEEEREAAEAREAEEERAAAEARKAEEEREAEEARKAEEEREAEVARKAEEEREAAQARKAEEERESAEVRKAEEEREAAEARKAEEEREAAEARKAEEEREAAEARQAEEEREARRAELEHDAEEARLAEEEERAAEAERQAVKRKAEEEARASQSDPFRSMLGRRELKPIPTNLNLPDREHPSEEVSAPPVAPPRVKGPGETSGSFPSLSESGKMPGIKRALVKPPSVKPPGAKPPTWLGGGAKPPSWAKSGSGETPIRTPAPPMPVPPPPVSKRDPVPPRATPVSPAAEREAPDTVAEVQVPEPAPVAEVHAPEPATGPDPGTGSKPGPVAEAEPEAGPESVAAAEPVAEAEPNARPEPVADVKSKPVTGPEQVADVELVADAKAKPGPVAEAEPKARPDAGREPVAAAEARPEPVAEAEPLAEAEVEAEPSGEPESESFEEDETDPGGVDSGGFDNSENSSSGARYRPKLASSSTSAERRSKARGGDGRPQGLKSKSLRAKIEPPPPPPPPPEPEPVQEHDWQDQIPVSVNWKVGDVIDGKFEVKELVGGGGMGTVWRVRHWEWNVDLAVKAPLPNLVADWADKERLILEAHTWVDLGVHPNIVQCWFVREYDGVPLLFLDYLPGGSLRDYVMNGQVRPGEWAKILDLSIQACDGLAHAHDHGLIHRDVKPANLLIGENGQLCVTDFGLVKVKKDEPGVEREEIDRARLQALHSSETDLSLTATGTVMGTPHYAAPEQWLGQAVGIQADIYAMGILMFELCCGVRPFDLADQTMSITHLVTCHVYQPPPDPQSLNADIPESLANCIMHCLLKSPEDRPQSMRELRETLANIYLETEGKPHPRPVPRAGVQRAAALNNKAVSLWNLNKTQEAFDAWREASKLDALHPESVYNRSMLQWRLGQIDHEEVLRRLTQVSSHYRRASAYLGYYHIERHNPGEAETIMQNGISMPELAAEGAVWRTMGDARMCMEHFPEAVRAYRQALQRIPEDRETQHRLDMAQNKQRTRHDKIMFPLSQPRRILRREGRVTAMAADHESLLLAGENLLEKMDLETSYTVWQWHGDGSREINRLALTDEWVLSMDTPDGRVWSRATGECLHTLGDGERFYAVLPGGKLAIAGLIDLKLVSLPSCQRVKALKGHSKQVTSVAITPDGRLALSGSCDRTARLWDTQTGECMRVLEGHKDMVDAVAISPDGTVGLSGGRDRAVRLWLLAGGEWIGTLGEHAGDVQSIKMTHDGRYAVISCATSEDNQLCVWDLQQASRLFTRQGVAALSPDGNYLLSGTRATRPPRVNLWELPSGRSVRTLEGHSAGICAICFTPDGQLAATASENGQVQVWEIAESTRFYDRSLVVTRTHSHGEAESARQKFLGFLEQARKSTQPGQAYKHLANARSVLGYDRDPEALAFSATLLSQLPRKALRAVWELRTFTEPSHNEIGAVALAGDGRVAVSAAGKIVRLWDLSTGSCVRGFAGHADKVRALALADDGRRVVSASLDKSLRLWNLQTGDCIRALSEHSDGVIAVAVSPDGSTAVSVTQSNQLHVWDLNDGQCGLTFGGVPTIAVALADDGKTLLSAGESDGSSLRLVNLATGKIIRSDSGFKASGSKHDSLNGFALDMTSDARFGLVAGPDHQLRLWDLTEGVVLRQLTGHTDRVNSLVMTQDGRYAVTASNDGSVRLWDVVGGTCLNTFQGHNGPVLCADMSFDGRFVLSAGTDQSFRLWELDWELDPDSTITPLVEAFPRKGLFKKMMGVFKKS